MKQSLTKKLIESHLVAGKAVAGEEIGLRPDQILLTDTYGIQSWLQFEAMGFPRVIPPRVVSYIDHQVFQVDKNVAPGMAPASSRALLPTVALMTPAAATETSNAIVSA